MKRAWLLMMDFSRSSDSSNPVSLKDAWTLKVIRMMLVFAIIPGLVALGFQIAGKLPLSQVYPIYLFNMALLIGWFGIRHGGSRWAGHIPAANSFILGMYGFSHPKELVEPTIFLFSLSVILAAILQGKKAGYFYSLLSMTVFTGSVYFQNKILDTKSLVSIFTLMIGIIIALLLLGWYSNRLNEIHKELAEADKKANIEQIRRLQVEEIQHLQESQLKRLTDHMTDLVAEIDFSGRYLYASPSYFSVIGYKPEEIEKLNAFDLIHPDDREKINELIKTQIQDTSPTRISYRFRNAGGDYVWLESSGIMGIDEITGNQSMIISSRDITEQRRAEESTHLSEKKFRSIIESIPMGIHMYTLDETSSLVFSGFNHAANRILGVDHSIFLGKKIGKAFPGLLETNIPEDYKNVALTGEPWMGEQISYEEGEIRGVFDVDAFQTEPGKMAAVFQDITEKRLAEEALLQSEEKFSKAFKTSPDSININRLSDGLYIDCNEGFTRLTGFTREDVIGKTSLEINIWANLDDRKKLVEGLKQNGFYENLEADFKTKNGNIIHGLMSAAVIKINSELCILNISRDISDRIESEKKMQEAHSQLEQAYEATLQGWARALDLREHETADHSRRVVEFTCRIAVRLGFDELTLINVQRGALLHDLGKVGVPDNILLKPGPLTSDEWVIMRQHPLYAYNLLKEIDYLVNSLDIPYCHHEHWDGGGYPRGLKGDEIPLSARIFTIVDVWDALLSDRPYRPAWNKQAVLNYLEEQCGKLFDPEIVKVFLQVVSDETAGQ